jgi:hypothetical protein
VTTCDCGVSPAEILAQNSIGRGQDHLGHLSYQAKNSQETGSNEAGRTRLSETQQATHVARFISISIYNMSTLEDITCSSVPHVWHENHEPSQKCLASDALNLVDLPPLRVIFEPDDIQYCVLPLEYT